VKEFATYQEARSTAVERANRYQQSYGIEKPSPYQKWTIKMIPNDPKLRFGWERQIEPVAPEKDYDMISDTDSAAATSALATVTAELKEIYLWEICSADDQALAADMLRDIKARAAALEARRTSITLHLNTALRAVNDLFRPPKTALAEAETVLKRKISLYLAAKAAANAAAVERAELAPDPGEAIAALAEITDVTKPPGVSVRERWVPVVVDAELVPRGYCSPDMAKLRAAAGTPIPGVRWERADVVAVRAQQVPWGDLAEWKCR
jgi:hypothetical protein